ncbi:MAG: endonuclease domain-containing protein [Azonexus sp.]|jgi:very-short-patch-repair endonuclease|nr:endonuclease domain-containing protein [Azonexus sp.]
MTTILQNAKALRQQQTEAEQKLWFYLRGGRFGGVKFKRQKPIGPYVVDFVAVNAKLVIELDGGQHQEREDDDQIRTRYLESLGYRVLRFWNNECLAQTEAMLACIWQALSPGPSPASGRGEQIF